MDTAMGSDARQKALLAEYIAHFVESVRISCAEPMVKLCGAWNGRNRVFPQIYVIQTVSYVPRCRKLRYRGRSSAPKLHQSEEQNLHKLDERDKPWRSVGSFT